jgi:hypothetical protein
LCEVNAGSQTVADGIAVGPEAVRGDLRIPRCDFFQLFSECLCVAGRAPPKVPSQNQLGIALKGREAVRITIGRIIVRLHLFFLLGDKAPNLICLKIAYRDTTITSALTEGGSGHKLEIAYHGPEPVIREITGHRGLYVFAHIVGKQERRGLFDGGGIDHLIAYRAFISYGQIIELPTCGKSNKKVAVFAGFKCGICGICGRNLHFDGQVMDEGSRAKSALIFLSWGGWHFLSSRFHHVTVVRSFHLPGLAALAIISSVIFIPFSLPFVL